MEASREFSRTPPQLPPCSDVSVLQKTRMSHFWDTHHKVVPFSSCTNCPHIPALVSVHLIGGRDRHMSKLR